MIFAISDYFVRLLCSEGLIDEQDKRIYSYGFQITAANIVNGLIIVLIAAVSRRAFDMLLFYLVFVSLRFYCGGYHAGSYQKCFCLFALTGILALVIRYMILYVGGSEAFFVVSILLQAFCMYRWAPIEHVGRALSPEERIRFRKYGWLVYGFWLVMGGILVWLKQKGLASIYSATLILVSIFMLIEKRKGDHQDEK